MKASNESAPTGMKRMAKKSIQKNRNSSKRKPKKYKSLLGVSLVILIGIVIAGSIIFVWLSFDKQEAIASMTVYKSPTCGCCAKWVDHMEDNGFEVKVINRSDVTSKKREFGVPERLYSCHTAKIDGEKGYIIEGHVPADDIKRLLEEKPPYIGLGVPGMPQGSPGMETGRKDQYAVLSFDRDKLTHVFSRY